MAIDINTYCNTTRVVPRLPKPRFLFPGLHVPGIACCPGRRLCPCNQGCIAHINTGMKIGCIPAAGNVQHDVSCAGHRVSVGDSGTPNGCSRRNDRYLSCPRQKCSEGRNTQAVHAVAHCSRYRGGDAIHWCTFDSGGHDRFVVVDLGCSIASSVCDDATTHCVMTTRFEHPHTIRSTNLHCKQQCWVLLDEHAVWFRHVRVVLQHG